MKIQFKIQNIKYREDMVLALAMSGYQVAIAETTSPDNLMLTHHLVVVEVTDDAIVKE